jgi:beta-glucosidase
VKTSLLNLRILFFACLASLQLHAQILPYRDSNLPVEKRVKDLLSRMTAEEKFYQVFMIAHDGVFKEEDYPHGIFGIEMNTSGLNEAAGQQMLDYSNGNSVEAELAEMLRIQKYLVTKTRLGIPAIFFGESLHGVVAKGGVSFPQSIALAASFNTTLMEEVSDAIATASFQRGWRMVLSPVVNVATDVRWGRTEETYGEDPYLCSVFGAAFVRAFESKNIVTTPKHFVANVGDGGRDSYPIHLDDKALNEIHYPPFRACFDAGARGVMASYNSLNGVPCSMNADLLQHTLKENWKFNGVVISDAGAVGGANVLHNTSPDYPTSGKQAIENGMDVIFQTSIHHDKLFSSPFLKNEVRLSALDSAVARVLRVKFELGLFENPYAEYHEIDLKLQQELALKAAEESIVLLKNENNVLPLSSNYKRILVVGEDATDCRLGGYSGSGYYLVNVFDGMKEHYEGNVGIEYTRGSSRRIEEEEILPQENLSEIQARYFSELNFRGVEVTKKWKGVLDFYYTFYSPDEQIQKEKFSAKFETVFTPSDNNWEAIGLKGNDGFRMYVNNELVIDQWEKVSFHSVLHSMKLEKGKSYNLRVEFRETFGNAQLALVGRRKNTDTEEIQHAVSMSKKADAIVVVAGIEEGEFQDRSRLTLPGKQEELILQLAKTGKPIVVVLVGGSAIIMERWLNEVDGVVLMWYAGEEQGTALANVLSGEVNPSGKLPITFPMNEGQLPLSYWHEPTGRGDDYIDGTGRPRFPFGYGLSYTTFLLNGLDAEESGEGRNRSVAVSMKLKNTGKVAGSEVVQMYVQRPNSQRVEAVQKLKGFQKVFLQPNEEKEIIFHVGQKELQEYMSNGEWKFNPGKYRIMFGSSSREIQQEFLWEYSGN